MCASSCAVAFLGGEKRFVADKGSILFHAPYLKQMQLEGKERITCDLPKEELQALTDYYSSMTSVEVGDRLYERTMWYCSAENGWTIKGGAAAELYGISTTRQRNMPASLLSGAGAFCEVTSDSGQKIRMFYASACPVGATRVD
jgi:hypothetical protein